MRQNITSDRRSVALEVTKTSENRDICTRDRDTVSRGDPVLAFDMDVAEHETGKLGDRIVGVSDAIGLAWLVGDVGGEGSVAD